ncbi:MAG: O-antigen ligase family protein [Anaerolineales bacterium]|nr:O-antigen ligase family protein [Anaerolineales bacterium]
MTKNLRTSTNWQYLFREMGLILLWAYVILVAGTVTGLINFRIHVASTFLGATVLGTWLIRLIIKRRKIALTGIEWGIVAFMAAQIATVIFSQDVRRSIPSLMMYGVFILVFYYVSDLVRQGWPIELIEKTLLIVGAIVVGLAIFQLVGVYTAWKDMTASLPYAPSFEFRLYAIFGDANLLAAFVNILIPIAIGRIVSSRKLLTSIFLGGLLLGIMVVVTFTSSRGGILGDLAAIFILVVGWIGLLSERAQEWCRKIWDYLRAHPALLGAIALVVAAPMVLVFWRVLQFQGDATHGPILSSRSAFWGAALDALRASPWAGIGPGTFPSAYIQYNAVPPDRPYLHAHSIPFTIAAESGFVGLAGLVIFAIVSVRKIWISRLRLSSEGRVRWVALVAVLVGFSIHSLVDNFLPYASVGIVMTVLFALLISQNDNQLNRQGGIPRRSFSALWLFFPALIILCFSSFSLRAYWHNDLAVDAASDGDWERASAAFVQAAELDPWLAHYWLQAGYAAGVLADTAADGDEAVLQKAIDHTEKGIALEPGYALHYANLSSLYWQAGHFDLAILNMSRAIELEPQVPILWLNLGLYAESLSFQEDARHAYGKLLQLDPKLGKTDFWDETTLRADVLNSWNPTAQEVLPSQTGISRGRIALANGNYSEAEELLFQEWLQNDQNVSLYLAFSELALAQGDLDLAEKYLHAALWIQGIWSNEEKVIPLLALAEINQMRGETELALIRYRQVYEALTEYTIFGWGTKGWNPYAWFVFQRRSLPEDILPQLYRPPLPPDLVERLMPLVELYQTQGDTDAANEVLYRLTGSTY